MIVKDASGRGTAARYSAVAIGLHWLIAAVIVLQLALGWRMQDATAETRAAILQLHKSIGLTILLLSVARLAWRLIHPPPPEPESLLKLEKLAATWVHRGLYVIMIGLPLTGWIMISASRGGAKTQLFGVLPWPKLPGLASLPGGVREAVANLADSGHVALVWTTFALLALHVAGALKHQLVSKDTVLARMMPGVRPGAVLDARLLAIPIAVLSAWGLSYAPKGKPPIPRPKVTEVAAADVFLDVVHPALVKRCASCHDDDRSKGGLSVVSYDALMAGGESGVAVRRGDPAGSELYKRITLAKDHDDYMPADGKTPLTTSQVAAIGWWISVGAPSAGRVADLSPSAKIQPALTRVLGLGDGAEGDEEGGDEPVLPSVPAADPQAIRALEVAGFVVRPTAQGSNLLDVNRYRSEGLTPQDVANLARIAPQIRSLSLRGTGATDAQLAAIGPLPHVTLLRLEQTQVTDDALGALGSARSLVYLNVYGTRVSDAGLQRLAALPSLKRVHAWETQATQAGADRLSAARPGLQVQVTLSPAEAKGGVSPPSPVPPPQSM